MSWKKTISQLKADETLVASAPQEPVKKVTSWKDTVQAIPASKEPPALADTLPAFAEGAGEVLTLGYAPQIKAGLAKGVSAVTPFTPQEVLTTLQAPIGDVVSGKAYDGLPSEPMSYEELKKAAMESGEQIKAKDKIGAGLGMLAGGVAGGGALAQGLRAVGAIPAVTTPVATALQNIGLAGLEAAAYNPGEAAPGEDPLQLAQRLEQAKYGLAYGAGGTALGELAPVMTSGARGLAKRSLGRSTQKKNLALGKAGVQKLGQQALDMGVVGPIPKTISQMANKVDDLRQQVGKKIGSALDDIDELEKSYVAQGGIAGVRKDDLAQKVREELIGPDTFESPEFISKVEKRIESFMGTGKDPVYLPTKGAHEIKKKLGTQMTKKGTWDRLKMKQGTENDFIDKTFYDLLGDSVIDAATSTAKLTGSKNAAKIEQLNKEYNAIKNMEEIVKGEISRSNTNRLLDLTAMIGGSAVGVGTQDPVTGLATAAGLTALRRFGPQVGAKALQGLSRGVSNIQPMTPALGVAGAKKAQENIAEEIIKQKQEKEVNAPTRGAKLFNVDTYETRSDLVPVDEQMTADLGSSVMQSDMTNTEKAKVMKQLSKGMISQEVLDFLNSGGRVQ